MRKKTQKQLLQGLTITMTLEEAQLLKRAAWDGPDPNEREQRVLHRILARIERVLDDEVYSREVR